MKVMFDATKELNAAKKAKKQVEAEAGGKMWTKPEDEQVNRDCFLGMLSVAMYGSFDETLRVKMLNALNARNGLVEEILADIFQFEGSISFSFCQGPSQLHDFYKTLSEDDLFIWKMILGGVRIQYWKLYVNPNGLPLLPLAQSSFEEGHS